MKNICRVAGILIVVLLAALGLTPLNAALADGPTIVGVSSPARVEPGAQFTVNIIVAPETAIAGAQFDLSFSPSVVSVDSVAEGDLFSQGGASTYFSPGTVDNDAGKVSCVAGVITAPGQSVSAAGTFAVITFTAGPSGTSPLALSGVVAGDIGGQAVEVSAASGQVTVNQSQNNSGGGGGGGGGGGSSGATSLAEAMTGDGTMVVDVTAMDDEQKVKLIIYKGSTVKNSQGQKITSVRIKKSTESHAANADSRIISLAYDIQPGGTIFTPSATLVFTYKDADLPEGVLENNLYEVVWDPAAGEWLDLGGTVDPAANTVSTPVGHLSIYALMAHTAPASFTLADLRLGSTVAEPGDVIGLSVLVSNTGDLAGDYVLNLDVDGDIVTIKNITLDGNASQTVDLELTASALGEHRVGVGDLSAVFTVKNAPVPAAFTTGDLVVSPPEIYAGDSFNISVSVVNTGELTGAYRAVLLINGVEAQTSEIEINGGETREVVFNIEAGVAGQYAAALDGLRASYTVLVPPPEEVASPVAGISDFLVTPVYAQNNRLTSLRLDYRLDGSPEQVAATDLSLKVSLNGALLEEMPLLSLSSLQPGVSSGSLFYVPSSGWKTGLYTFRIDLYAGDSYIRSTGLEQFTVAGEAVAAVVSWQTLGIIIGAALMLALIIVTAVIVRRRDMLHG